MEQTPLSTAATKQAHRKRLLAMGMIGSVLLGIDQLTKLWARRDLVEAPVTSYLNDLFRLTYAENSGAFLSLGAQFPDWLRFMLMVVLNGVLLLVIAVVLWNQRNLTARWQWGWCLVLVGGMGNLIDRVAYQGHVIDFMNMGIGPLRTGIFNVADMYLTAGFFWLAGCSLLGQSPRSPAGEEDSSRSSLPVAAILFPLLVLLSGEWSAARGDTVIYKAGARGGHVGLNGEILEFNQREMVFRVKSPGTMHRLTASQIVSYDADFLPAHEKATKALSEQDFTKARSEAEQALKTESRNWIRRELLAIVIQAAINQQDWSTAAITYQAMLENDPDTRHQDLIPLFWSDETLQPQERALAERDLDSPQPAMRLIYASWLLTVPEQTAQAATVLADLLISPSPLVRHLARSQLWRIRIQEQDFNDGDLTRWERQLDDLSDLQKAGPQFVLARGYEKQVQPERAAAAYLWITIMDARRVSLARQATLQAAELLGTVGQLQAAQRLKTEAADRFPEP